MFGDPSGIYQPLLLWKNILKTLEAAGMYPGCFSFIFGLTQDLGVCGKFHISDLAGGG